MNNELNPLLMSSQDAVRWYIPQNEVEAHFIELLKEATDDSATKQELTDRIEELERENRDFEEEIDARYYDIRELERKLEDTEAEFESFKRNIQDALDKA